MPLALPSLGSAFAVAWQTLRRFPLAILAGALAATAAILGVEDVGAPWLHERLLTTATLGIPLCAAAVLLAERQGRPGLARLAFGALALAVLAIYFAAWPGWSEPVRFGRFAQLGVAFSLLAVTVPFIGRDLPRAFWQFLRVLLERAILTAAFGLTLFLGLALALAAADKLFGVDVPPTAYMRVWMVTVFLFSPWFLLGGVPEDPPALEARRDYPAVLRVFAQYALVPLVTGYLVILTLYLGKVVITWQWPSGWIGWLVSGVAIAGISAVLLVHPIADDPDQRWVGTFTRQFWLALIPSLVMLWMAVWQRVAQYGVTERRYFLIVLSLWLAGLAVWYGVTRSRNIKVIPLSLAVLALLTIAGPWGAYGVSEASQVGRLHAVLERNGMFAGGTVRQAPHALSAEDQAEVSAVARYLVETHGVARLAPWFADTAARRAVATAGARVVAVEEDGARWNVVERAADTVVTRLGVAYVSRAAARAPGEFSYSAPDEPVLALGGYDYLLTVRDRAPGAADTGLAAVWSAKPLAVRVLRGRDTLALVPLDSLLARLRAHVARRGAAGTPVARRPGAVRTVPVARPDLFVAEAAGPRGRVRVLLHQVAGKDSAGVQHVNAVYGRVLLALKR